MNDYRESDEDVYNFYGEDVFCYLYHGTSIEERDNRWSQEPDYERARRAVHRRGITMKACGTRQLMTRGML
jgi:hypothetical protein